MSRELLAMKERVISQQDKQIADLVTAMDKQESTIDVLLTAIEKLATMESAIQMHGIIAPALIRVKEINART